jgi:UDP-N-acetylglucosamine:LPS N-acetylglucosamine transferase
MKVVSSLATSALQQAIASSEMLISRAGYSSIMDYVALGRDAILVPTPGQTEQEYLADEFKKKKIFYSVAQKDFNLAEALQASRNYSVKNQIAPEPSDLKKHLESWLERIRAC